MSRPLSRVQPAAGVQGAGHPTNTGVTHESRPYVHRSDTLGKSSGGPALTPVADDHPQEGVVRSGQGRRAWRFAGEPPRSNRGLRGRDRVGARGANQSTGISVAGEVLPGELMPGELMPGELLPGELATTGFTKTELTTIELTKTELTTTELTTTELTTAELTTAELTTAELTTAELTPAELTTTELTTAELTTTVLTTAVFTTIYEEPIYATITTPSLSPPGRRTEEHHPPPPSRPIATHRGHTRSSDDTTYRLQQGDRRSSEIASEHVPVRQPIRPPTGQRRTVGTSTAHINDANGGSCNSQC